MVWRAARFSCMSGREDSQLLASGNNNTKIPPV